MKATVRLSICHEKDGDVLVMEFDNGAVAEFGPDGQVGVCDGDSLGDYGPKEYAGLLRAVERAGKARETAKRD